MNKVLIKHSKRVLGASICAYHFMVPGLGLNVMVI